MRGGAASRNHPRTKVPVRGPRASERWHARPAVAVDGGAAATAALIDDGVVGLRSILPTRVASSLSAHVDDELCKRKAEACADDASAAAKITAKLADERWFGAIRDRRDRFDLRLCERACCEGSAAQGLCCHRTAH